MIQVFTTSAESSSNSAGQQLTDLFDAWKSNLGYEIEIVSMHSNSNKFGWMLVIQYKQK